jgi:hypothetical protein
MGIGRVRLAALAPRLDVALGGTAYLCTSDHGPWVWWEGMPDRPPGPPHVDVSLNVWTPGRQVAIIEVRKAKANGRDLQVTGFRPLTLAPQPAACSFFLWPTDNDEPPPAGSQVRFCLRRSSIGFDRRVKLRVSERTA